MRARILGSGAGGGVPQWNCGCANCTLARARDPRVAARSQDSVAVAARGDRWLLVNASPDIRQQIESFPDLWPRSPRDTPIAAIALTNGDLDHVVGLLTLRESQPLRILATQRVRSGLVEHNAVLRTLARTPEQVAWTSLEARGEVVLDDVGLGVTALPIRGKLPLHLVGVVDASPEDNVALRVRDLASGRTMVIATAVGVLDGVLPLLEGADAVLFDGTFWSDDELLTLGLGTARARDMAHVPVGGQGGSLAGLAPLGGARRIYTHVNNTNPMIRADSPERAEVTGAGWEVATDGMEISL
ncbi:MAG: pyrroloquinoline quinone biosynthesis protein PqqB [Myxococcota bacterium]|nr:pyrroloquinoline quinone biosynthesis protein PqqB [Myxococcota bacterium]